MFNFKRDTLERPSVFGEGDTLFRYNFAARYAKNKKVLDIGTGYGDGANYFFTKGAREVVGIDNSKMAIKHAKETFIKKGLRFEVMDALKLKLPKNYFDVVTAFEILEHLPMEKHKVFLENIKAVLKKDGVLLLSTPNKLIYSPNREKPNNPYHIKEFLAEELEVLLKRYFSKVDVRGIKIINKQYIKQYNQFGKDLKVMTLGIIGRLKIIRELAGFIPKSQRIKITGENKFPKLTLRDFKLSREKRGIEESRTLFAILQK